MNCTSLVARLITTGYLVTLAIVPCYAQLAAEQGLSLKKGDHICIIGNTLADRMQHDGWLETAIQSRFPGHELVIRNLGFSGDELTLRLRSRDFGTPDDHLRKNRADVIFAFFGYNESFGGEKALAEFKEDLGEFVKHTLAERYNGSSPPRLVIFSPIAHENLGDRNLPDGSENNRRLQLYARAMAGVAAESGVVFVDLLHPTQEAYATSEEALTINGIHLNTRGNQVLAEIIDAALFRNEPSGPLDWPRHDKLRSAVLDKNFHWFNRYRTVDGYSIYGGRADLRFVEGQTNRDVMQREMEILDAMAANRDKKIWAAALGEDLAVDDSNTPPFIPVQTNKPGAGPNGLHIFLGGEEAIGKMTIADGMKVELFASEEMFPELINPVQMAFDTSGRLWVAAWPTYPHWKPKTEMNDKLLILEDTNGDGRADVCKTFVDDLHNPTGFEFYGGGVIVAMAPDVLYLKDTDGDDRADVRERILSGIDSADTHHTANSFVIDPGGALYFQEGTFHHTQVETPYGPPVRSANAGVYRYEPKTQKFDAYVTFGFANPHGHVFDRWGKEIVHDGTGAVPYDGALFSGHLEFPQKHNRPPTVYQQRTRPCPATEIISSRHFPEEMQGNLLVGNVIGFQGILRYEPVEKGASFTAVEKEPILYSSDESFRPVDLEIAPDGSLYFTDWQNPIIGHMQHNLRDPSRDQKHGRVYRVTYPSRPLLEPAKIAGEPISKLLDLLKEPEDRVRYRAKIELSARDSEEVIAELRTWMNNLDSNDPAYEHQMMEALWVHQYHNMVNVPLLERMIASQNHNARAAAVRVLCYWRDRVPYSLDLLKNLAEDEHPRVRLEAARTASFYEDAAAVDVALSATASGSDEYLEFVRDETMRALEPFWRKAVAERGLAAVSSSSAREFLLNELGTDDLLKLEKERDVYEEILFRPGVRDEFRNEAISQLANIDRISELRVLLSSIAKLDELEERDESVIYDFGRLLTNRQGIELSGVRDELENMATDANSPVVRQIGYVALVAADGNVDAVWNLAQQDVRTLHDLVLAAPLISDPAIRSSIYPKIQPLLDGLPAALADESAASKGTYGQYVRIELPGRRRTLTLAEVEVFSDGRNVARGGKADQINTTNNGDASRAIDGNTDGSYSAGGQTHTRERTRDPWWEVDLGAEYPIDLVTVHNRNEGNLGRRLDGFALKILDSSRKEVFIREDIPAPDAKEEIPVGGGGAEAMIRRAAMTAITYLRGYEQEVFDALSKFIRDDISRSSAIRAIQRIPRRYWPAEQAEPLLEAVIGYVSGFATNERSSPVAVDALQLGDSLASLLPTDRAKEFRSRLGELGVRVIRLGTIPHRMSYDREQFVVAAGRPMEIVFENNDIMPHNFVITRPGKMEEIGILAENTAQQPDAMERHYVPVSEDVLFSGTLLQPRQSERLSFDAPREPGVYPYVCTYPGHWRRMYGAMYVVANLEEYQSDPVSYLASHSLPIQDELLQFNRPRTAWKLSDLAGAVEQLDEGRSFATGKQMFQLASCVSCHRFAEEGKEFGPDLAKLDPKPTPVELLQQILEPSAKINEKYETYILQLASGQVVTGLIVGETENSVQLVENPLAKPEPITVEKSEIDERIKSPVSTMPEGLLDRLTRDEILDLVAYVVSGGDEHHAIFHGGHQH